MKIGEISMNINTRACNYGSILHSWAFQYYLKKYEGISSVETINYVRKDLEKWNRTFPAIEYIKKRKIKKFVRQLLSYPSYRKRLSKVDRFIKNNMNTSKRRYYQSDLSKGHLEYDLLVSDGDTIWAPRGDGSFDKGYFLHLPAMSNIKKISYAPSMGNAVINNKQMSELKELLDDFSYISCRESYECDLLSSFIDKKIVKVLDPVLLLDVNDWDYLIQTNYREKSYNNYVLVYQPVDESVILEECANIYAEEKGLKVIKISIDSYKKTQWKSFETINDCSPEGFLYLIKNADAIFTNSFHMICFSIIFKKEFYSFSRKDDRKIIDICDISGLGNRFFRSVKEYHASAINYDLVYKIVEPQIIDSRKWLHNAIYN